MLHEITQFTTAELERIEPAISKRVILYGCGDVGMKTTLFLQAAGVHPLAFSDANSARWGKKHMGLPVISPAETGKAYGEDTLVIICVDTFSDQIESMDKEIGTPLRQAGCRLLAYVPHANYTTALHGCQMRGISLDGPTVELGTCRMPNFFRKRIANIDNCFSYVIMDYLLTRDYDGPDWPLGQPYDRPGTPTALREGDVVLDCGANLGIFAAHAAHKSCHVYAFEPAVAVFEGLEETAGLYPGRIASHCLALGDRQGKAVFSANADNLVVNRLLVNGSGESGTEVTVTTVDAFVAEQDIDRVDFIKADIEGAERDMLRGAAKTLKTHAPRLAICAYHLPDDPEVLQAAILSANPHYTVEHIGNMIFAWV